MQATARFGGLVLAALLAGCAALPRDGEVPSQRDRSSLLQFGKSDFDRLADVQMRENTQSLRHLMTKLYKRNPRELKKSTSGSVEDMVGWVFEGGHGWQFRQLGGKQYTAALELAFDRDYRGDRVLALIVGLQTMLIKAHGDKNEFFLTDRIDPQRVYNAARNLEIAAWRLAHARDADGQLLLLTNALSAHEQNLSFEREFGKMIGRTDLFAITLAEKSQRMISRVAQNLATALFLPF